MKVTLRAEKVENILADALIVNEFEGVKVPGGATGAADKGLGGLLSRMTRDGEFTGRLEEIIVVHGSGKLKAKKIILVGLGKREKFDLEAVRKAAGAAIRAAKHAKCKTVASIIHGAGIGGLDPKDAATATIEGTLSAAYKFKGYATTNEHPEHKIQEFILVDHGTAKINAIKQAVKDTVLICDAVNSVRDLVNAPGNIVTPEYFANAAKKLAKSVSGLTCQIIDAPQIRKMGMGAFYSIAKGSDEREKMVVLKWHGDPKHSKQVLGLIGKGITFDSGGISIKPANKMWEMKTDMAGAAVVLHTMLTAASLKIKKNVLAVMPLAENMPDGRAIKPGDVVTTMSGKTVEIISTDAEGRMLLADAITYAKKNGATSLIDVATLTGACVVCLGDVASGLMSNDAKLTESLEKAAKKTGEKVWELPLYDEFKDYAISAVADIKNATETGKAGTSSGALFIKLFAGETPWVHLDIAGTTFLPKGRGYLADGATGVPLRTLVEFLRA